MKNVFLSLQKRFLKWRNKVSHSILGDSRIEPIENRLFNAACVLTILLIVMSLIWNYAICFNSAFLLSLLLFFALFYGVLYYLSRFRKKLYEKLFVCLTTILLSFVWLKSEGSNGSTPGLYIMAVLCFVVISKRGLYKYYFVLLLGDLLLLYIGENSFLKAWVSAYPTVDAREADVIFVYCCEFILCYFFIVYFKRNYNRENSLSRRKEIELKELNATKDRFFSIIAHDLRGPFNSFLNLSKIMSEQSMDITPEIMHRYANQLRDSANNVYGLLENLLDWSRLQQGLICSRPLEIHCATFVRNSLKPLRSLIVEKEINLILDIPLGIKPFVDENMFSVIIRNLVSNAIKYSYRGGRVLVGASMREDNSVEFWVRDKGIGMSAELVQKMFRLDVKLRMPGTEGEMSTGLGLILCRDFAEKAGGRIEVESIEGEGSCFKFIIPDNRGAFRLMK